MKILQYLKSKFNSADLIFEMKGCEKPSEGDVIRLRKFTEKLKTINLISKFETTQFMTTRCTKLLNHVQLLSIFRASQLVWNRVGSRAEEHCTKTIAFDIVKTSDEGQPLTNSHFKRCTVQLEA